MQAHTQAGTTDDLTEKFSNFFGKYCHDKIGQLAQHYPSEQRSLYVDYDELFRFDENLAEDYRKKPEQVREYAEEALRLYDLPVDIDLGGAHVRLMNLGHTLDIRDIRVHDDHIGQLVSIQGLVRKATDVRPKITEAAFECQRCGTMTYIPQSDSGFQEPHECQGCERQGPFNVDFDQSVFIDSQKLRIQESPEGLDGGQTPQSIDIDVEDDAAGTVTAGDHATVTGVLHIQQKKSGQEKSPLFDLYMDGHTVLREDEDFSEMDITDEDREEINALAARGDIYDAMVESVAPTIYGYEEKKLAMVLQLFGGTTKHLPDGSRIRGDMHILFIGDPGVGKSQLLQYVRNIAPRSVYTSGKGSSAAGLTAAAVKDDFSDDGQWTLEAGALVLADKGVAAIDELDKMDANDQSAMHEGLEQQEISISKAGINATLKSRCSVLGAANPKYGRFDQYEPIGEQIELDPALISRFDLIFTFVDEPDAEDDRELARHILNTNRAGQMNDQVSTLTNSKFSSSDVADAIEDVDPEIDPDILRKYVAVAQTECSPVMTEGARSMLEDFYVDFRSQGTDEDSPIPVTARKLEALVRLAEASARVRLSDEITTDDAQRVIDTVTTSLKDVGMDPDTKEFDADIVETGTSKSKRDNIKNLESLIREEQPGGRDPLRWDDLVPLAEEELGLSESDVKELCKKMHQGKEAPLYYPTTESEGVRVISS